MKNIKIENLCKTFSKTIKKSQRNYNLSTKRRSLSNNFKTMVLSSTVNNVRLDSISRAHTRNIDVQLPVRRDGKPTEIRKIVRSKMFNKRAYLLKTILTINKIF